MALAAAESNWSADLERGRNEISLRDTARQAQDKNADEHDDDTDASPAAPTKGNAALQKLSARFLYTMWAALIETFGLTLIPLFIYTFIKDLTKSPSFTDPADFIVIFGSGVAGGQSDAAAAAISQAAPFQGLTKLFVRIFIYVLGGGATLLIVILLAAIIGAIVGSCNDGILGALVC